MDTPQAIVLGFVQGVTEFLPVSSTAHLRIVPAFLGWDDPGAAFTAVIQLGTVAAILGYFRADIARILAACLDRTAAARYSLLLSIPAVVLSGLLELHATEGNGPGAGATVVATLVAFVVGYASIAGLLKFLTTHSTRVFVLYRVVVGALVLALAATGTIS